MDQPAPGAAVQSLAAQTDEERCLPRSPAPAAKKYTRSRTASKMENISNIN